MLRENRIKNYNFSVGSLTAGTDGLFSVYSDHVINGTIHSISVGSNTYTNTGSLLLFASGTDNGINNQDLIIQLRAGSRIQTFYPVHVGHYLTSVTTSAGSTAFVNPVINSPLRLVGSALGNGASGLYYNVRYI